MHPVPPFAAHFRARQLGMHTHELATSVRDILRRDRSKRQFAATVETLRSLLHDKTAGMRMCVTQGESNPPLASPQAPPLGAIIA